MQGKSRSQMQIYEKEDPGVVVFTSGFSREKWQTVGKRITVGKLIELQIIMTISRQ